MGLFPTDASDGDQVVNANGTVFEYDDVDDKWFIVSSLTISDLVYDEALWNDNPDGATKNVIRDKFESLIAPHTRLHAVSDVLDHSANNHKVLYTDGYGHIIELALGADGEILTSNGIDQAPSWQTIPSNSNENKAVELSTDSTTSATTSKLKQITCNATKTGSLFISWQAYRGAEVTGYTTRIYRNGSYIGGSADGSTTTPTWHYFTYTGGDFVDGDTLELWMRTWTGGRVVYCRYFMVDDIQYQTSWDWEPND